MIYIGIICLGFTAILLEMIENAPELPWHD